MINKAIYVIIFMYAINGGILIAQYTMADIYGLELTNAEGTTYKSRILETINIDEFNQVTQNIENTNFQGNVSGNPFNRVVDFNVGMAYSVWELVRLLTGTEIFFLLMFFGVPEFVVAIIIVPYIFLLIRTIVGLLRGF